ncbi:MAG: transposase [Bdellovibrionales bacterium]|nr:transposase [Bdellovibrionales bacterium]
MKMHREFPDGAKFGAATISKTASGRYRQHRHKIQYEREKFSTNDGIVGVDLNIKQIVLSDGEKIQVPKTLETLESRKRRLQKKMQRQRDMQKSEKREDRSNNYEKTRLQLAKLHEKIKFQREDYLHKLALNIYRKNQVVAMETLNVKGMMKTEDWQINCVSVMGKTC